MEGKLIKWTNYLKGWKERLFVLKGPLLYYYYGPKELPRGKVHLGLASIIDDEKNDYFEINTGSNIFFLKAENPEMRDKWLRALKKAKIEGEKAIREILKKNKNSTENPEFKDLVYPELNYDAEMEQLNSAVTRIKMDNQSLFNFLESKNIKDPELKILSERYKDDFEILETCIKSFDPLDVNYQNNNIQTNQSKQIIRNSSFENLKINEENNNNIDNKINNEIKLRNIPRGSFSRYQNKEEDDYSVNNDNININNKKEPLICFGEEFYEMNDNNNNDSDDDNSSEDNFKEQNNIIHNDKIVLKNNNNIINKYKPIEKQEQLNTNISIKMDNNNLNNNNMPKISKTNFISNSNNKYYDPLYDYPKRTCLPSKKKDLGLNVWKVFKSAVGKDLSHFGVPVFFNEPISSLQKFCEPFQYAHLLISAANEPNPYIRLANSAAFCIGQFVINNGRQAKFFNPLLYETYEYVDIEQNFRYMSEQVSHHPAISAYYAEGDGWNIYANTNAVIKFIITGKLEVNALGKTYITYSNYDDVNAFTKPKVITRNLIIGTIDIDVEGKFEVTNEMGDVCEVDMIPSTSGQKGNLHGKIKDINGDIKYLLEGNWQDKIYIIDNETKEKKIIWKIIPSKGKEDFYYQPYTFDLNNLTEEMKTALPPTDSRFRPDQRLMEYQDIDKAGDEKHRLEEEQRARAKQYKKDGFIPKPIYFDETYDDLTGELIYKYKGNYWDMRYNHRFENLPKIF